MQQANALWLHVGDGTRELLLSHAKVRTIIQSPVIKPAPPSQSSAAGLVVHRNDIYSAFCLSALLGDPPCDTVAAAWGLLLDDSGIRLVLLTTDFFGLVKLGAKQDSFTGHCDGSPRALMGYARWAGRDLLLLDPFELRALKNLQNKEETQRWFDAKSIKPAAMVKDRKTHRTRLVVLSDGGRIFAFPARAVCNMRRLLPSKTPAPGLCECLGKSAASQNQFPRTIDAGVHTADGGRKLERIKGFTCTIRGTHTEIDVSFEALLESIDVSDREIRTWIGMSVLTLAGAFVRSPDTTVLLVDPDLLVAHVEATVPGKPDRRRQDLLSGELMPNTGTRNTTKRMVSLSTGNARAMLMLSSIRFVSTVRSAHIHQLQTSTALVIGVLERAGMFTSILNLGVLLGSEPTRLAPNARLVEVGDDSGSVALLAAELSDPEYVQMEKIHPYKWVNDGRTDFDPIKVFTRVDDRQVPILETSLLIAAARGVKHA